MIFINYLSYGLLSLLSTQPMSGYVLTIKINRFWRSTHSAIYPLLSELEENGYIEFIFEKQNGKPDKKIYNLTVSGKKILHDWFMSETGDEVIRDEMILKLYCIKCVDTEAANKILEEFEERCKRRIKECRIHIENIKSKPVTDSEDLTASVFGAYILTQRSLNAAYLNLRWCEWVRQLYEKKDFTFLDENYDSER